MVPSGLIMRVRNSYFTVQLHKLITQMKKLSGYFLSVLLVAAMLSACDGNNPAKGQQESAPAAPTKTGSKITGTYAVDITREEFLTKILDYTQEPTNVKYLGNKPAIVDFWASWCGPCRIASPILEELAKEYHGKILVYKVDTQKEQQISAELGIQSIPTFIFFPVDGKPFATSGIASTPEDTRKMFVEIIEKELLGNR